MIEQASPNGIEARYSIVIEEFVEDEWWQVGAKVCGVVDNVAGDLLQKNVRELSLWRGLVRSTSQSSSRGKSPAKTPWNLPVALYL